MIFSINIVGNNKMSLKETFNISIGQFDFKNTNPFIPSKKENSSIPTLQLQIGPQNLNKLIKLGGKAFKTGVYVAKNDDWVPAYLHSNKFSDPIEVSVRLKGKWNDHRVGKNWSILVKTKQGKYVLGMEKFILQSDATRNGHRELLLREHAKELGLIAPKINYVNVVINGDNTGMMMMEQALSQTMLEKQQRHTGPIVAFNTVEHWKQHELSKIKGQSRPNFFVELPLKFPGANNYLSQIDLKVIAQQEILKSNPHIYFESLAIMRGYQEGNLPIHQVFDMEKLAKFMALIRTWASDYSLYWTNMRWYFDPLTKLYEPIVTETLPGMGNSTNNNPPFFYKLAFENELFLKIYNETLDKISFQFEQEKYLDKFRKIEKSIKKNYSIEKKSFSPVDFNKLIQNTKKSKITSSNKKTKTQLLKYYPIKNNNNNQDLASFFQAYLIEINKELFLEFNNFTFENVHIKGISILKKGDKYPSVFYKLPLNLPARVKSDKRIKIRLPFKMNNTIKKITVEADKYADKPISWTTEVRLYSPAKKNLPRYSETLKTLKIKFPFLIYKKEENSFYIPKGKWNIKENLLIPFQANLVIDAGSTLRFSKNVYLFVNGALLSLGTKLDPIILTSDTPNNFWNGLLVHNQSNEPSKMNFTEIENIRITGEHIHYRTGAISFVNGTVLINDSSIINTIAEDALNVYHTNFKFKNLRILYTYSDALDMDYSDGEILGLYANEIGGDGIDLSGTKLYSSKMNLQNVYDKAISVGERSDYQGLNESITNAGTGIAVKDSSKATLKDSKLYDIHGTAYMSYRKKDFFQDSELIILNNTQENVKELFASQNPSIIIIDNKEVSQENFDSKILYKYGRMKKITKMKTNE